MNFISNANIKVKLIIFLSIMLLIVCGALSFFFAIYAIEVFEEDIQKMGLSEASNLAIESKFGTLTEDSEILMPLLVNKLKNKDILFIKVFGINQKEIAAIHRYPPVLNKDSKFLSKTKYLKVFKESRLFNKNQVDTKINYYKITSPIQSNILSSEKLDYLIGEDKDLLINSELIEQTQYQKQIGEIHIGISSMKLEQKTHNVLTFIGLATLNILVLAVIIAYAMARRALTPLLTMSNIATQVANSDLKNVNFKQQAMILNVPKDSRKYRLESKSNDEVGLLASAFIKMSSRLKDYGQNLEQQVLNRTEELSNALQLSGVLKSATESANKKLTDLNQKLELFQRCIEETSEFVLITDAEGIVHTINQAFLEQNGYSIEQIEQHSIRSLLATCQTEEFNNVIWPTVKENGEWKGKTQFRKSSDVDYPVDLSITSVRDDQQSVIAYICISRDITLEQKHQQELIDLASRDPLTGLFNRRRFREELEKEIVRCQRYDNELALCWLDLDFFKEINDSLGHPAGDELLKILAKNLKELTRETDLVARLGGDEFAVLLSDTSYEKTTISAERIINGIRSNLVTINNQPVRMMISMGIALYPSHALTVDELLASADVALYKSKNAGRNQFSFFHYDDKKNQKFSQHNSWIQKIWDALEQNRLVLFYQPILNIADGTTHHYELLVRMYDEQGDLIMPKSFISIAERTGMIHKIDRWVIQNAVQQYAKSELNKKNCKVTVNLSAKALGDESFPDFIESIFSAFEVDPKQFIFEITENSAIADFSQATAFISRLKKIGCEFALDDFGVGFASFSHLKKLDISYLKIDGSFIKDILLQPKDRGIVEAMINVAHSLNIKTVAEWVENSETLTLLNQLGIDYVQGYYIGKPEIFTKSAKRE